MDHFLVIMVKVLMEKLPFDQVPFYCLGIKQMFREIKLENDDKVNYHSIENYVLG